MLTTVEGIYRNGKVELDETLAITGEKRVRVTFLDEKLNDSEKRPERNQMIRYGMFAGPIETSEEDFKLAEFHGDPDDGLDWSGL